MYQKIMVPLDGSELAECVLPHVESIAKGCSVPNVILVRVVEPALLPTGTLSDGGDVFTEEDAKRIRMATDSAQKATAESYLDQMVSRLSSEGVNVKAEVLVGKAAETLAEYAEKNDVDLIVMATHGRSGVTRWVRGSVAEKILRSSKIPVLMVRAPGTEEGT